MKTIKLIVATVLVSGLAFTSCKKDDNSEAEPKNMSVRMTDAPGDYSRLDVEIASVEAYNESKGWIMLRNETQVVSVLDLTNGNEVELVSETKVKSGSYTKLRLTFGDNNKIWVNTEASVDLPFVTTEFDLAFSSPSKQYEIVIDEEVDRNSGSSILLDFNVAESVSGSTVTSFVLDPEITMIKDENTGLRGEIEGSKNTAIMLEGNSRTYSTYADSQGRFLIRGVVAGTYDVTFMPSEDDLPEERTVEGVVIADGEIESMGTVEIEE